MTSRDVGPEVKNPYEIALWVLTGALLVGSASGMIWAQGVFSGHNVGWNNPPPVDIQTAQVISMLGPGGLTGGIILAGMALGIRALSFNRRSAGVGPLPAPSAGPVQGPDSAVASPMDSDRKRVSSTPVDHTPYMRPQSTE